MAVVYGSLRIVAISAILLAFYGFILSCEHIAVPAFVDLASCKEPGKGTVGQAPGEPCGLTNLPSRQSVLMVGEQCHNEATALLEISP